MFKNLFPLCLCCPLLISCSASLEDYKVVKTPFDIKSYFNGSITGWGTVQDRNNMVTKRFCVEIDAKWQQNNGRLSEVFYFDDGTIDYRTWELEKMTDGNYKGSATDVIGIGLGEQKSFAFNLQYTLLLDIDDKEYEVTMDDWMFQIDKYRVMNKTAMSKFGFNVANVTLFFDKQPPVRKCR